MAHEVKWSEVAQSCPTLCDPMDGSLPGSAVHGVFQARILEWAAISFSRGSSQPRDRTCVSCIADRHFTVWATRETLERAYLPPNQNILKIKVVQFRICEAKYKICVCLLRACRSFKIDKSKIKNPLYIMAVFELFMPSTIFDVHASLRDCRFCPRPLR